LLVALELPANRRGEPFAGFERDGERRESRFCVDVLQVEQIEPGGRDAREQEC
jgi:hypothetical protein